MIKINFFLLILIGVFIMSCSKRERTEGVFYNENNSVNYYSPLLIISKDTLYVLNSAGDMVKEMDTFNIDKNYFYNKNERISFKTIGDTILVVDNKSEYFGQQNTSFDKLKFDALSCFYENLLIKTRWYTNDIALVEQMNKDTIFFHFDESKKYSGKALRRYVGSNSYEQPSIDSWKYLKKGEFNIIKFDFYIPAYFIISEVTNNSISGFMCYPNKKPKKSTLYKDRGSPAPPLPLDCI